MSLRLRNATPEDIDLLFGWANDPVVRQNAFNTEPIPYENHQKWFNKMLYDESVCQYILCSGDEAVGQIRLNIEGDIAFIDYSVAPDMRGKGLGSRMLKLVIEETADNISGVTQLLGQVKLNNQVSAKAFEKCGFSKIEKANYIEYTLKIHKN